MAPRKSIFIEASRLLEKAHHIVRALKIQQNSIWLSPIIEVSWENPEAAVGHELKWVETRLRKRGKLKAVCSLQDGIGRQITRAEFGSESTIAAITANGLETNSTA